MYKAERWYNILIALLTAVYNLRNDCNFWPGNREVSFPSHLYCLSTYIPCMRLKDHNLFNFSELGQWSKKKKKSMGCFTPSTISVANKGLKLKMTLFTIWWLVLIVLDTEFIRIFLSLLAFKCHTWLSSINFQLRNQ